MLTGRIVDSYTNILTVKLFARAREEDAYVQEAVDEHTVLFHRQLRLVTRMVTSLATINAVLVVTTAALAIYFATQGTMSVDMLAMVLPLTWQIVNISGWVAFQVTSIFENIGVVQEGIGTIAVPLALADQPGARAARGHARRYPLRGCALRLWPRDGGDRRHRISTSAPARRSAWSAARAPASRRWSTSWCASSISKAGAS